ncbi:MAG: FKBP-type peptidyl-prolyl cis-trans isomerase [Paludibacteraceae bacterium]|nr:FKBP-type peptidyl-prolyl cis-trans isomerase [Paludibacteraceae bacterium]
MARNIKTLPGGKVNKDALIVGLVQALNEDSANYKLDIAKVQDMLQDYFQKAAEEDRMAAQLKNEEYLSANKKKDGVVVTESGLQYKVINEGTGAKPKSDDVVKVHYTGRLTDGTVFDSSVERGTPAEFPVNQVIPGWTEALQLMSVGSKYELTIPAKLGYGERPAGPIPANSILLFEVELLDIVKK